MKRHIEAGFPEMTLILFALDYFLCWWNLL